MNSLEVVCSCLLAFSVLPTISAQLYSLDSDSSVCAVVSFLEESDGCVLPCTARSTVEFAIPPRVNWARMVSFENRTLVPLDNPFWVHTALIDFYGYEPDEPCRLDKAKSSDTSYHYDCSPTLNTCKDDVHLLQGVEFQCFIEDEHSGNGLSGCVRPRIQRVNPEVNLCYAPVPSRFAAVYSNTTGITLNWSTVGRLPDQDSCENVQISVQVSFYSSYDAYNSLQDHADDTIFFPPISSDETSFRLAASEVRLDHYYVFDVVVRYRTHTLSVSTIVKSSQLFYFGIQESPTIIYPVIDNMRLKSPIDGTVLLRCEATGIPPPSVRMYHRNLPLVSESSQPSSVVKTLVVNEGAVGEYICVASGTYVPPNGGAIPETALKKIVVEVEDSPQIEIGDLICASHGSTVCHPFFGSSNVLINTSNSELQESVEEAAASLADYAAARSNGSDSEMILACIDVAMAMVCHSSFPFCTQGSLVTRKVCNSSCEMFSLGGVCDSVLDLSLFPDVFDLMLANCDTRENPAGSDPECIHVPLEVAIPEPSWCSRGNGQSYSGDVIITSSGNICQEWAAQRPHAHPAYDSRLLHLAGRDCRNPGGVGERPWCYTSDYRTRWEYCEVPRCTTCEPYTGGFCAHLLGYKEQQPIYVDRHESEWDEHGQARAENWMLGLYHRTVSSKAELPDGCREGLQELVCHSTIPLCSTPSTATPPPDAAMPSALCSGHCQLMELLQVCPSGVLDEIMVEMQRSLPSFFRPICDQNGGRQEDDVQCLPVETKLFATVQPIETVNEESCYNSTDHGLAYGGTVSTTESGTTCQSWGSDLPDAENYCRNPGHVGLRPWCFTDREANVWEYCDVQMCGVPRDATSSTATTETAETEAVGGGGIGSVAVSLISSFAVFGVMLILISIILAIIFVRYHVQKHQKANASSDISEHHLSKLERQHNWDYVVNQTYSNVVNSGGSSMSPKLRETINGFPQVSKSSIKYIRQLGQGNFGVVFYAKAEGILDDEKVTEVAVKTLKEEEHCSEALEDFVREAKLMFSFDHHNIVKILGVCTEEVPYYLVFEYMDKGDLAQFLRCSASSFQRHQMNPLDGRLRSRTESTLSDEPPSLTLEQLVDICRQIAGGMKYLAENNHVHRDLACRNCLAKSCDREQTDSGLIIKIGDFGMSQNLYSSDYYRVRGQAVLPVRWMSPEAVIYGKFSTDSDVWSFGVVMWEVFTFAMQPYYGTSNEEVTESIRRHKILAKPADCPNRFYEMMKTCWTPEPKLRPTFTELHKILSNCRVSLSSSSDGSMSQSFGSDLDSDAFEENSMCEDDVVDA